MVDIKAYLVSFYKFWYKFIIGDDWVIAASIMWSLLAIYSLSTVFVYAWYLLPILVSLLLIWSLNRALSQHKSLKVKPLINKQIFPYVLIWSLVALIIIVPNALLYLNYDSSSLILTNLLLPTALSCDVIILIGLVAAPLFKKRPITGTLVAGIATLIFVQSGEHHLIVLSGNLAASSTVTGWFVFILCALLAIAGSLITIRLIRTAKH